MNKIISCALGATADPFVSIKALNFTNVWERIQHGESCVENWDSMVQAPGALMTLYPQSKVRMFYNDVIRLPKKLTYCWVEFLYYILFKRRINSRVCGCAWILTLNIWASSHSTEAIWPSYMQFSQLSCPFDGDKWISRIMQVRSLGVKNWLFSCAITFVLPWHLWTFIL